MKKYKLQGYFFYIVCVIVLICLSMIMLNIISDLKKSVKNTRYEIICKYNNDRNIDGRDTITNRMK